MSKGVIIAIVFFGVLFIYSIIYSKYKKSVERAQKTCKNCGEVGLEFFDEEEIDRYNSTKTVRDEVRNEKGEVIRTVCKEVPVTKAVYLCTYKCKYCGYEEKRKSTREM